MWCHSDDVAIGIHPTRSTAPYSSVRQPHCHVACRLSIVPDRSMAYVGCVLRSRWRDTGRGTSDQHHLTCRSRANHNGDGCSGSILAWRNGGRQRLRPVNYRNTSTDGGAKERDTDNELATSNRTTRICRSALRSSVHDVLPVAVHDILQACLMRLSPVVVGVILGTLAWWIVRGT